MSPVPPHEALQSTPHAQSKSAVNAVVDVSQSVPELGSKA